MGERPAVCMLTNVLVNQHRSFDSLIFQETYQFFRDIE